MRREVEERLALPVPNNAGEMHALETSADAVLWLVKPCQPGEVAPQSSWTDTLTTRFMIAVWAVLAAALLIGACADEFGWYRF